MRHLLLLIPLTLSLIACGTSHEGTVTYQVRLKPSSVTGSTIADDVHVEPEDPQWKTFLIQARETLGEAPTGFEVTSARIQLDVTKSRNVSTLQDVLASDVVVYLRSSATGTQVDLAELDTPKGSAQLAMDTTGDSLEPLKADLTRGDFRIGLRGSTPRTSSGDFEGFITLTLDVSAR